MYWGKNEPEARGSGKYLIKAGEMGGPYPQFLAYHIVKALVNREMQRDGKSRFFGSAEFRMPYEQKFLKEAEPGTEDAVTAKIRAEERARLMQELNSNPIAADGYTSSETRRKALKKKGIDEPYAEANAKSL